MEGVLKDITGRLCSRNKLIVDVVGVVTLIIYSSQLCSESSRSLWGVWSFRKLQGADLGRRAEPLERQYFHAIGRVASSHIRNMSAIPLCHGISTCGSHEA